VAGEIGVSDKQRTEWESSAKTIKAVQVAFEMEQRIALAIREMALISGLTPSDQIRKIIGLSYSPPKRPRLTVSLSTEDYQVLGQDYGIDPSDTLAVKRAIMGALIRFVEGEEGKEPV
jgi:hypothetical protein